MNQRKEFEKWWDKNKPTTCEEDPCIKSYAERAWEEAMKATAEDGLIALQYVNEDVAERIVGLLHKCEVKCKVGIYKIMVCRVSDGRLCNG